MVILISSKAIRPSLASRCQNSNRDKDFIPLCKQLIVYVCQNSIGTSPTSACPRKQLDDRTLGAPPASPDVILLTAKPDEDLSHPSSVMLKISLPPTAPPADPATN